MPTAKFCTRDQLMRLSTAVLWRRVFGAKKRKAIGSRHVAYLEAIRDKDRQREQLIDTVYNSQVYRSRRVYTSPIAKKPASATTPMPTVAEGVATTKAAFKLSEKLGVRAPITRAVYGVLYENISIERTNNFVL